MPKTKTGRLQSTPKLQNIPIRTEEGRRIREAFTGPPGASHLKMDYARVEQKILDQLRKGSG